MLCCTISVCIDGGDFLTDYIWNMRTHVAANLTCSKSSACGHEADPRLYKTESIRKRYTLIRIDGYPKKWWAG